MKKSKSVKSIKSFDKVKMTASTTRKIKGGTSGSQDDIGIEDLVSG